MSLLLVNIIGARPQFIKAAAVVRAMAATDGVDSILVHTGQHYDENMSKVFFDELQIPVPDYDLEIGSGTHGAQTGRMLEAIEAVLLKRRPDWVFVYGDTNSTLAGALASAKLEIPIAHIEAGLRSYNRAMPEEINRVLTDHVSDLLFAPTEAAVHNLGREGIAPAKIHLVGDVMYDVACYYGDRAESTSSILKRLRLDKGTYVLATVHRAENTDDRGLLNSILEGLRLVSEEIPVILPLHPRTRAKIDPEALSRFASQRFQIIDPVGYLDMIMLEKHAALVATDSGGVQKEAYFYEVPCVTLRSETEWVELVDSGWNRLVPPVSPATIRREIKDAIGRRGRQMKLYGEGDAARRMMSVLLTRTTNHQPSGHQPDTAPSGDPTL